MQETPVQMLGHIEELSRLRDSEAKATQQAMQLRLQLDLLEAQLSEGGKDELQQLQAKSARLAERAAELDAALAAAEERSKAEAAAHHAALSLVEEAEERLEAEVAEVTRQLEAVISSQKAQEDTMQDMKQQVERLEAENSALLASCDAAGRMEAELKVGARVSEHRSRSVAARSDPLLPSLLL